MSSTIKISKGLRQSYKNAVMLTVEEALYALKKRTDCYEVLNDEFNRPYGDIDGKVPETMTESEFNIINQETRTVLEDWLSKEDYSLMTASSYLHRKISYRFVFTNFVVSKEDNKEWIKKIAQEVNLPDGVQFDFGVYGKNWKMRMVGSNKDGENRPLRLLHGTEQDTLISYIPESAEKLELPKKEKKEKQEKKGITEPTVLSHILEFLDEKRFDTYEDWLKIGMICYSEGIDVSIWDEFSKRSLKYKEGECAKKWKTFSKNSLTIATLWDWLKEDNPAGYEQLKQDDYEYKKIEFEKTHFKLMNPAVYVRLYNDKITLLKHNELLHLYNNMFCNKELFISKWIKDPTIRTYEELVYKPNQAVSDTVYNIFTGFPIEPIQGDISAVHSVLQLIANNDKAVFDYIEHWVAWILQKPYSKTGTSIIIQGDQGIGKDTYFDFVGKMFGEYFFNTNRAEEDVFGKFNGHLKKILLMKFEEASFLVNKKNESSLKSLITCNRQAYENKGIDPITLDNYFNIVMTTNNDIPVHIEQTDRRFVLIKGSNEQRGKLEFWNSIHDKLGKPETLQAYMYYLLNLDLSNFNPRDRPITEYYEEVKQAFIPYHARYFQRLVEDTKLETHTWTSRTLFEAMKAENQKFDLTETKFGRDMKLYFESGAIARTRNKIGNNYTLTVSSMIPFLHSQNWWIDY